MGSCTAGGAYVPAMSDETVIVQEAGHDLPRRPAAGEGRDRRGRLGRGSRRRRRPHPLSGVADHLPANDAHALALAPHRRQSQHAPRPSISLRRTARAAFDPADLSALVPTDLKKPYDMREVIARIVDGSEFDEFKARYGTTLVTGFAHIHGCPVGIVANNGILFSESALKGAHFIELCASAASRCCSCRTSPASWSGANTRPAASPRTAPSW
jgi:3-methylcrotonyl-CoA carboxylase beta subunit